ncbi:MAG: SH3 domain-containing protein [Leptolyngbyaceae cyanobacterium]
MLQDEAQQQALSEMLANSKLAIAPPEQPAKSGRGDMFLLIGVIGIGLAVFLGIMTARGSKPAPEQPTTDPTPTAQATPQPQPTTPGSQQALLNPTPSPTTTAQPSQPTQPMQDVTRYQVAQVNCPGCAANFRSGPSINSPIVGSVTTGDLVQLTGRVVNQDGVVWVEVGYRGQFGWIASQFINGGPRNG